MDIRHLLAALVLALPLAACGGRDSAPAASDTANETASDESGMLGRMVRKATDKARKEMAEGNFKFSADGQPRAEITPDGQLLVDGSAVQTTPEQRAQLLEYRQQLQDIALAGIDVGVAGADLATHAAAQALKGVLSGNVGDLEARVNAESEKLEQQARNICLKLPAMLATQQALARSLPAFAPYATMEQRDIDDCSQK